MSNRAAVAFSVLVISLSAVPRPDRATHARGADVFTTSEQCGVCHTVAPGATAMKDAAGDDVSPFGLWQATMMGNAFRDPYFRAQLQKESAAAGEQVQELCLRCHAPMAHHQAVLDGKPPPRLADVEMDLFADDSVSCTVCHSIAADGLGDASTFSGRPRFDDQRRIFGPYADVQPAPMQNLVRYTPTQGLHVRQSALCGTCHTLITEHHGTPFPEQTPYLEWRNSDFRDEPAADGSLGATPRTCQQCHMPETGPTRIARNPMGFDFRIPRRPDYRAHAFVGGNAFMLDMLREHREDLDVQAEAEALARMAEATRRQLRERTAHVAIEDARRDGETLSFAVRVTNQTGHKFPTGYPARRAWLRVEVLCSGERVFVSGDVGADGRLVGVADEQALPHVTTIRGPGDVLVYELVATDPDGRPTTFLTKMVGKRKDNRLLPRGFVPDGPHVAETAPVGAADDADFVGGEDVVRCEIPMPSARRGLEVRVELLYQSVPPVWVDALRGVEADEAQRFVTWYDAAAKRPEVVAAVRAAVD
jgi:cytochrome c2